MRKQDILDALVERHHGYLSTADAIQSGISRSYLGEYVNKRNLQRVAHGLYMVPDVWVDDLYILQFRYPNVVFSHETALYLHNLAEREPLYYSATLRAGTNSVGLIKQDVKVYKVREPLFSAGIDEMQSPSKHAIRVYNRERTICDMVRSRRSIDIQDLQSAVTTYLGSKDKNVPLLMRYAKLFTVEETIRRYAEVLLR